MRTKRNALDAIYEHEAELKRKEEQRKKDDERYFICAICKKTFVGSVQSMPRCPVHSVNLNIY